jgi:iron uptake system component EfeO
VLSGDHVVGQVELLAAGRSSTISLDLPDGMYRTNCQVGAAANPGTLAVGGATGSVGLGQSVDLSRAADAYRAFLVAQADGLIADLEALSGAVARGDLVAAREAYASARSHYGQVEPAADNFGDAEPVGQANLAQALDGPFGAGPADPRRGLRLVESGLWGGVPVTSLAPDVAGVLTNAQELRTRLGAMHLDAVEAASGSGDELSQAIVEVRNAVDSRPLVLDVTDLQAAADGARGLLGALHPVLARRHAALDATLAQRWARLDATVATARASAADPDGGLASTARASVVEAGDALADAMAQMAPVLDEPVR